MTDEIAFSYKFREALGFGKLHSLSHLDTDARQMRVALTACAPLAHAAIAAVGKDRLGYIGGADTTSQEPVTVTIQTTLGALREARRALFVANIEPTAPAAGKSPGSSD